MIFYVLVPISRGDILKFILGQIRGYTNRLQKMFYKLYHLILYVLQFHIDYIDYIDYMKYLVYVYLANKPTHVC